MEITATIKDTERLVQVSSIDNKGRRSHYKVELGDFINSISYDDEEGSQSNYLSAITPTDIPSEIYKFQLGAYSKLFTCHAVFIAPAEKRLIDFCGQAFYIPMPALAFDFYVKNERLSKDHSMVYALDSQKNLCRYPLSNVYDDGRICWGSLQLPHVENLKEMSTFMDIFLRSSSNTDLSSHADSVVSALGCETLGQMIKLLEKKDSFPKKGLIPLGISLDDLI